MHTKQIWLQQKTLRTTCIQEWKLKWADTDNLMLNKRQFTVQRMQHKQFSVRTRQCQKWQTKTLGFGCRLGQRCSVSVWHSARVTVKNVWNHYVSKSSHHYSWIFHRSSFITDRDWVWFLIFTYPHPRAAKRPAGSDRRSNRLQKPFYSWFNSSDVFFTLPDMYALTDRKTARAFDQTYTTCLSEDEFMNACVYLSVLNWSVSSVRWCCVPKDWKDE